MPIHAVSNVHNEAYLKTKREKMGHILHHQGLGFDDEMLRNEAERDSRPVIADSDEGPLEGSGG